MIEDAKNAGFTDEELIEIVRRVVMNVLTNYMNETMQTEMDFSLVEPVRRR